MYIETLVFEGEDFSLHVYGYFRKHCLDFNFLLSLHCARTLASNVYHNVIIIIAVVVLLLIIIPGNHCSRWYDKTMPIFNGK